MPPVAWGFSSMTATHASPFPPTPARGPPPAAVFLETSFPDRLAGLAGETGHLWPAALPIEMAKLGRPTRWIIVHRKAAFAEEIRREIEALALPGVEMVQPGFRYEF